MIHRSVPADEDGWLRRLGYRLDRLAPQLYQQPHVFSAPPSAADAAAESGPQLTSLRPVSGQLGRLRRLLLTPRHLSLLSRVPLMTLRQQPAPELWPRRISSQPGPLGAGCLLMVSPDGRVRVRGLPSVDAIAADVLTQVFNNSFLVNVTARQHGRDVFYFVKPALWSFASDHDQLSRLAPFNVTAHKHSGGDGAPGRPLADLRIRTATATVHLRYGAQPEAEHRRHVRHAHRQATRAAWSHERQLLRRGLASRRWSGAERETILAREGVAAQHISYRHEAARYPELAGDLFNVRFGRAV